MASRGQRVVVTGASGHVGAALSRALLERGAEVTLLVHHDTRGLEGLPAARVRADLADLGSLLRAFQEAEVVYHLAAVISLNGLHLKHMRRINVEGTRNVVEACRRCGVRRLIHFSSIEALADLGSGRETDESNPLASRGDTTSYGLSKAEAELLVRQAAAEGLDAVILSPTAIVGPYDCKPSHLGRSLLDLYYQRLPALIRGGFNWVDVRDVAQAALAAQAEAAPGERFIVSGTWLSLAGLARLVEQLTRRRAPRLILPAWLARGCAHLGGSLFGLGSKFPAFTPDALLAVGKHRRVSCQRAARALGYAPRPLEETLRDTFRWFGENGFLER